MKRILFLTGTRADFGKLRLLIRKVSDEPRFETHIFVTGMHMLSDYGSTYLEIERNNFRNIYKYINQQPGTKTDQILSNTVLGLSNFVHEIRPDLIVVHGDRVECLAGAIVGSLNNILVAHVEGGEVSGTVDELIRHAVSKLSHVHFVANHTARRRLLQLGEEEASIHVIGSPDIDEMLRPDLPSIEAVKAHYGISFPAYAILLYHPVTTELGRLEERCRNLVDAVLESGRRFVVIHPNNDPGSDLIRREYARLKGRPGIVLYPSIRFEFFLTLLKHCELVLGNSSAGIREAPIYGRPVINVGSRQNGRSFNAAIVNVPEEKEAILAALRHPRPTQGGLDFEFGDGKSSERFLEILLADGFWSVGNQKRFVDRELCP